MSLNITLDISVDDPNIPVIDPIQALIRPSSLAIYDCQSSQDLSGRGNHMTLSAANVITATGITLTNTNGFIATPMDEPDEFTIISCHNLSGDPTTAKQLVGNFAPNNGFRWQLSSQFGGLVVSTEVEPETLPFTFYGAWTIQAVTVNATQMQRITHSGATTSAQLGGARKKSSNKIWINGADSSTNIFVKDGFNGTLGFMLVYDEVVPSNDIIKLMDVVTGIMADRGQPVP